MAVIFKCPDCGKIYRVGADKAGLTAACSCGKKFVIPEECVQKSCAKSALRTDSCGKFNSDDSSETKSYRPSKKSADSEAEFTDEAVTEDRDDTRDFVSADDEADSSAEVQSDAGESDLASVPGKSIFATITVILGLVATAASLFIPFSVGGDGSALNGLGIIQSAVHSTIAVLTYPAAILAILLLCIFYFTAMRIGRVGGFIFGFIILVLTAFGIISSLAAASGSSDIFGALSGINLAAAFSATSAPGLAVFAIGGVISFVGAVLSSLSVFSSAAGTSSPAGRRRNLKPASEYSPTQREATPAFSSSSESDDSDSGGDSSDEISEDDTGEGDSEEDDSVELDSDSEEDDSAVESAKTSEDGEDDLEEGLDNDGESEEADDSAEEEEQDDDVEQDDDDDGDVAESAQESEPVKKISKKLGKKIGKKLSKKISKKLSKKIGKKIRKKR